MNLFSNISLFPAWRARPLIAKLFDVLFFIISAATFRHTTIAFASIEGTMLGGALSAIAIDVTMYLTAVALGSNMAWWGRLTVGVGLLASAGMSAVAQLLFSVTHAEVMTVAVAAEWFGWSQQIIDYRVVVLPFSLPVFALLVTAAGKVQESESVSLAIHRKLKATVDRLELELDEIDALHAGAIAALNTELDQARARANQGDRFRVELETLRSFGVKNDKDIAATLHFLHNGNTGTLQDLADAMDVSKSTVRLGKKIVEDKMKEQGESK